MSTAGTGEKQQLMKLVSFVRKRPEVLGALLPVAEALTRLQYGTVEIKVQDGVPVWVDVLERQRAYRPRQDLHEAG